MTYLGPLLTVLFLSFLKELLDEIKRAKKDRVVNDEIYSKMGLDFLRPIKSKDIKTGDIILVKKD